jgi:tyrosine recombinase xerC
MKYIDDFLDYLRVVRKHSDNTIISYHGDILEFSLFVHKNILKIDKAMVEGYLTLLYEKNEKKSTIGRKLTSLRVFYDYLLKNKIVSVNYFSDIKNPKKDKSLPKYVKDNDIDKMFLVPDTNKVYGQRNLVIIRLLYATGVRVDELVNIRLKDIDVSDRTIRILGKGSKERVVVFGVNTQSDLKKYLSDGRRQLDIKGNDYLFLNKDGNRLSSRYVRKIIDDIVVKASIKMHISPHMLRHTFATEMLNNGADLVSVKDLLGHESLNTTSIYTHLSDDKIREIYDKTHPRAHCK